MLEAVASSRIDAIVSDFTCQCTNTKVETCNIE